LNSELTKGIRILAAQLGKRQNELLEETLRDLLNKYSRDEDVLALGLSNG
jgi:hypothetical protein